MSQYAYLEATAQVKVGAAKLKGILFNSGTNPTVAVYNTDTASTSGTTVISTMTATATPLMIPLCGDEQGVYLGKGLYVVIGGTSPKVTLIYD